MPHSTTFRPGLPEWVESDKRTQADLLNQLQITDINEQAVFESLIEYAKKYNTPKIPLKALYQQVQNFAQQHDYRTLSVNVNATNAINSVCKNLYKKGFCKIQKQENGKISALILEEQDALSSEELETILEKLKSAYNTLDTQIPKHFPSSEFLPDITLSSKTLREITLDEFSPERIEMLSSESILTQISIPNQKSIVIPSELLPKIHTKAINIIKYYLRRPDINNSSLLMRIKKHFPNLTKLKTTLDLIREQNKDAQYWVTFTNEIIDIAKEKKETIFIQAALLIKNYWIKKNETEHKLKNKIRMMETLVKIMEKNPHPSKKSALLELYHKSALFQEYKQHEFIEIIEEFLQNYTTSEALDAPPVIFTIESRQGESLYIHQSHIINLIDQEMSRLSISLKNKFQSEWKKDLMDFTENKEMQEPSLFEKAILSYISEYSPFYSRLLHNPPLFYNLFVELSKKNPNLMKRANLYFDHLNQRGHLPTLKPLSEILGLDREILIKEVKKSLPFSYRFPLIRAILALWHNITHKKSKPDTPHKQKHTEHIPKFDRQKQETVVSEEVQQRQTKIRQELQIYRKKLLKNGSFKELMQEYESRWNRSLSEDAKADNRSIIRNMLHSRLRYLHSPTAQKIEQEACDMLATEDVLKKISDREAIKNYLILYMTEYLNKKYSK